MRARWLWLVLAALGALIGCAVSFDREGQPCDTNAPLGEDCLTDAGYRCVDGRCTQNSAPDAGR